METILGSMWAYVIRLLIISGMPWGQAKTGNWVCGWISLFRPSFHSENTANDFRSHYAGRQKTQQSTVVLDLCLRKKITWLLCCHRFRKATFLKCYPSTPKRKASVSKFLLYVERFRKVPFSWRISVDRWPNKKYSYVSKFPRPW